MFFAVVAGVVVRVLFRLVVAAVDGHLEPFGGKGGGAVEAVWPLDKRDCVAERSREVEHGSARGANSIFSVATARRQAVQVVVVDRGGGVVHLLKEIRRARHRSALVAEASSYERARKRRFPRAHVTSQKHDVALRQDVRESACNVARCERVGRHDSEWRGGGMISLSSARVAAMLP